MKVDDQPSAGRTAFKGGSALALENNKNEFYKNKIVLEGLKKKLVFENDKATGTYLDENLLKD